MVLRFSNDPACDKDAILLLNVSWYGFRGETLVTPQIVTLLLYDLFHFLRRRTEICSARLPRGSNPIVREASKDQVRALPNGRATAPRQRTLMERYLKTKPVADLDGCE